MAGNSAGLHEDASSLMPETIDRHRAIASLMEELEAVDWYDQRIDATGDASLRGILVHNRDEEKEHAAMILEWLRRVDPALDENLRRYLFTDGPISERSSETPAAEVLEGAPGASRPWALDVGALRDGKEVL